MMNLNFKSKNNSLIDAFILPAAIFFMFASIGIVMAYFTWLNSKVNQLEYRIAVTKATYNAESGIAEKAYPYLLLSSFEKDTTLEGRQLLASSDNGIISMGGYEKIEMNLDINDRHGSATGVATWGTGEQDTVRRTSRLHGLPDSFGKYMYFTDYENAGGAPFSFGPPNYSNGMRRDVKFYGDDELFGVVQSNHIVYFSDAGCPDFDEATWILTEGFPPNAYQIVGCTGDEWKSLFRTGDDSEIDTLTGCPLIFPPPGYEAMKNEASLIIDGGTKLGGLKDTLIMTDIEFQSDGRYIVKQWWYLMPPHLRANIEINAQTSPYPQHLDGVGDYIVEHDPSINDIDDIDDYDYSADRADNFSILTEFCDTPFGETEININTCKPYLDSLRSYHAKRISSISNPSNEAWMDQNINNSHGIAGHHFDFKLLDNDGNQTESENFLIRNEERTYSSPIVIYIKDGPVRLHGSYKGRYSIVTDEYTTYRRHAWNDSLNGSIPIDTIWNDIWLIDDLINSDAQNGNMSSAQPDGFCRGGSNNIMGIVSGANIIVANTKENGAVNGCTQVDGCSNHARGNIRINAGMIALNESFVVHYWQNTTHGSAANQPVPYGGSTGPAPNYNPPTTGYYNNYWSGESDNTYRRWEDYPPWADSRGREKADEWNLTPNSDNDKRGEIYLWGGVVQKYRGYVYRNPTSPYSQAWIGYQSKDYHYDANLRCNPPPHYPYIQCEDSNGQLTVTIKSAATTKELTMSISIYIGTSEVKLIELSKVNDTASVARIHSMNTWKDINSFNPEKLEKANWVASIKDICSEVKINPKRIKSITSAISGRNLSVKEITTLEMNEDELFQSLEFEAKKHIPLDGTDAVMDYHIIGNNDNEIDKINVLLVATTKNIIKQFDSIIRDSGFKNSIFDAEPIALANCLSHNYGKSEDGIDIILDIGTNTSTLVVCGEGQTFFTREIEVAGFHILSEIMKKYDTDYSDAQKILNENGINSLNSSDPDDDSESFSLEVAEKTIFSNLIDETRKSLRYYVKSNNGNSNFKRLFLSGGFAEIEGLKEKISDELRIETEILDPFNKVESDVKIDNPSKYAVAVGLALRGLL